MSTIATVFGLDTLATMPLTLGFPCETMFDSRKDVDNAGVKSFTSDAPRGGISQDRHHCLHAIRSPQGFIALSSGRTGIISAAINVRGSTSFLTVGVLRQFAHVNVTGVPYRGGSLSIVALIGGQVDIEFAEWSLGSPQFKMGLSVRSHAAAHNRNPFNAPDDAIDRAELCFRQLICDVSSDGCLRGGRNSFVTA